jgi:hypothetical protein
MGMFDTLTVEYPLDPETAGVTWQTKSLDCMLDEYLLSAGGELMSERYHLEDRSDPSQPGLLGLLGALFRVHEGWDETHYTGSLNFYAWIAPTNQFLEYEAEFLDGKTTSIKRIQPKPEIAVDIEGTERIERDMHPDQPTTEVYFRLPNHVIEDLEEISKSLGLGGYEALIRAYISKGLRNHLAERARRRIK